MTPEVAYLFSLDAVRERSSIVYNAAKEHRLNNFDFHEDKLNDVADYVTKIIEVCVFWGGFHNAILTEDSETLVLPTMTPFLPMDAGSILRSGATLELHNLCNNGSTLPSMLKNAHAGCLIFSLYPYFLMLEREIPGDSPKNGRERDMDEVKA
jgi:hypothetical protein